MINNSFYLALLSSNKNQEEDQNNISTSDTATIKGETHSNIRGRNDRSKREKSGEQSSTTQAF